LTAQQQQVLWQIRLPRTALAALVGASLAVAGAGYQGVFRNPLADPYLLGVSAGAGLGAALALGFGLDLSWGPVEALPMAAFLGALVAVSGSVLVARGSFRDPATLLLAGVAIAAFFAASQTYALQQLDQSRTRDRKSTRLNSSHVKISYAVFCLKKKNEQDVPLPTHHTRPP